MTPSHRKLRSGVAKSRVHRDLNAQGHKLEPTRTQSQFKFTWWPDLVMEPTSAWWLNARFLVDTIAQVDVSLVVAHRSSQLNCQVCSTLRTPSRLCTSVQEVIRCDMVLFRDQCPCLSLCSDRKSSATLLAPQNAMTI